MSLEALAERAGLSPNYVGSIEANRRDPSLSTIEKLARGLKVSPGELVGGYEGLSGPSLEGARLLEHLQPAVREGVLQLLRTLPRRR